MTAHTSLCTSSAFKSCQAKQSQIVHSVQEPLPIALMFAILNYCKLDPFSAPVSMVLHINEQMLRIFCADFNGVMQHSVIKTTPKIHDII